MSFDHHSNDQVRQRVGDRLRAQRRSRGLTQQDLAELAGLSRPTVSTLERGNDVSLDSFLSVLRALGLLDGLDTAVPEPAVSPMGELQQRSRSRAATPTDPVTPQWVWGDEQ